MTWLTAATFLSLYLFTTIYLIHEWQRYEPTKAPIDLIAALSAWVISMGLWAWQVILAS